MNTLSTTSCAQHKTLCCSARHSPASPLPTAGWAPRAVPVSAWFAHCCIPHIFLCFSLITSLQLKGRSKATNKVSRKTKAAPGNSGCPIFLLACPTLPVALILISPGLTPGSAAGRAPWLCCRSPTQTLPGTGWQWCWLLQLLSASGL